MLFTVYTSYKGFDKRYPHTNLFCNTVKIDAESKEDAKRIAWENIKKEETEVENIEIREQRATLSKRVKSK